MEHEKYLEQYNQIISNKLKLYGVYELIELWNKTKDNRFKNLSSNIIKEIYVDLYNRTNKNYYDYMRTAKNSNNFYSKQTQNKLHMFESLTLDYNINEKYPELWYFMHKLEIERD